MARTNTSVIMTHWAMNKERSEIMRQSVSSLIKTAPNIEIIIVDNGGSLEDSQWFLEKTDKGEIACYIRNRHNMSFGYARNQGLKLCSGEYIVISDNDIFFEDGWLEECLKVFEEYPDEKIIVSHLDYPTGMLKERYDRGYLGKYKLNMRAGSNCFMMKRNTFEEMGYFEIHKIAGTKFTDKLVRNGYLTAVISTGKVVDMACRKGYDLNKEIEHLEL